MKPSRLGLDRRRRCAFRRGDRGLSADHGHEYRRAANGDGRSSRLSLRCRCATGGRVARRVAAYVDGGSGRHGGVDQPLPSLNYDIRVSIHDRNDRPFCHAVITGPPRRRKKYSISRLCYSSMRSRMVGPNRPATMFRLQAPHSASAGSLATRQRAIRRGHAAQVAIWSSSAWRFVLPPRGARLRISESGEEAIWNSSARNNGQVTGNLLILDGNQDFRSGFSAISGPVGVAMVDAKACAAIAEFLEVIRTHGPIVTSSCLRSQ